MGENQPGFILPVFCQKVKVVNLLQIYIILNFYTPEGLVATYFDAMTGQNDMLVDVLSV